MDFSLSYCPERRTLEERGWNLVDRLAVLAHRLLLLAGVDHDDFVATKAMCAEVRDEIAAARERVLQHRADHGC